jgi:hypothetical protein
MHHFPLPYRWFIVKGLTKWEPWYFLDTSETVTEAPVFDERNEPFAREFKLETGADFDVYLFARRQDMDDYAFFVFRDGKIEDKVISIHLTFSKRLELRNPLRYSTIRTG